MSDDWRGRQQVAIIMFDSRKPYVPMDSKEPVPYFAMTTLINYRYAQAQGADFVFYVYESPGDHDPRHANDPVCLHPTLGWRAASWCKVVAAWHVLRNHPQGKGFVYIDSDAVFRSPELPPSHHLDHLTPYRPIGFLSNWPWEWYPCAGYFFFRPEAEPFLRAWWDVDLPEKNLERLWEQAGLKALVDGVSDKDVSISNPPYRGRIALLREEWQFVVKDPLQLIHHLGSGDPDRYELIQSHWNETFLLDDRKELNRLLEEITIVTLNASMVAMEMAAST